MKITVRDVDRGFEDLTKLAGQRVAAKVGIIGERAAETRGASGLTNADLALIHEFGTARDPERSFLRSAFDAHREQYLAQLRGLVRRIYERSMTLVEALGLLGQEAASNTREKIRSHIPPPNSPATIAAKGSSTPLIDSGQLLGSISYDVGTTDRPDPEGHRES